MMDLAIKIVRRFGDSKVRIQESYTLLNLTEVTDSPLKNPALMKSPI